MCLLLRFKLGGKLANTNSFGACYVVALDNAFVVCNRFDVSGLSASLAKRTLR